MVQHEFSSSGDVSKYEDPRLIIELWKYDIRGMSSACLTGVRMSISLLKNSSTSWAPQWRMVRAKKVAGKLDIQNRLTDYFILPMGKPTKRQRMDGVLVQKCKTLMRNRCPTKAEALIITVDMVNIPKVMVLVSIWHPEFHQPLNMILLKEDGSGAFAVETARTRPGLKQRWA